MSGEQVPFETFSIGEIAIHWHPGSPNHGKEVMISSSLKRMRLTNSITGERSRALAHDVEIPADWVAGPFYMPGKRWSVRLERLRKKRPPVEDRKVVRWDECPWQPESLHV
jgi:hypothetical protein